MQTEKLSIFIATAIYVDGTIHESELNAIIEIAKSFGIDEQELKSKVDGDLQKLKTIPMEELDAYLASEAKELNEKDALAIFNACLKIVVADGELDNNEAALLIGLSEALPLNLKTFDVILMIADAVKKEINNKEKQC